MGDDRRWKKVSAGELDSYSAMGWVSSTGGDRELLPIAAVTVRIKVCAPLCYSLDSSRS